MHAQTDDGAAAPVLRHAFFFSCIHAPTATARNQFVYSSRLCKARVLAVLGASQQAGKGKNTFPTAALWCCVFAYLCLRTCGSAVSVSVSSRWSDKCTIFSVGTCCKQFCPAADDLAFSCSRNGFCVSHRHGRSLK